MTSNAIFISIMLLLPAACLGCFLAGGWIYHRASKGLSPLPPMPIGRIKVNNDKMPPKPTEMKRIVL